MVGGSATMKPHVHVNNGNKTVINRSKRLKQAEELATGTLCEGCGELKNIPMIVTCIGDEDENGVYIEDKRFVNLSSGLILDEDDYAYDLEVDDSITLKVSK